MHTIIIDRYGYSHGSLMDKKHMKGGLGRGKGRMKDTIFDEHGNGAWQRSQGLPGDDAKGMPWIGLPPGLSIGGDAGGISQEEQKKDEMKAAVDGMMKRMEEEMM